VKFLVDNQLPPALARFLEAELGAEAQHVADLGLGVAADAELWNYASAHNAILISKDEDFATMILQKPTARLIWVRVGNCRKDFLLNLFRQAWPRIIERLEQGDFFLEIR
jgi:predicted nuclease of predicted toxin-antitoxin system